MAEHNFQCAVGDRSTPLSARLYDAAGLNDDISSMSVYFAMDTSDGTNWLAETTTGVTIQPGQTFTADTTNSRYSCNNHGFKDDWEVVLSTSAADLPAPLSTSTRYFIRDATPNHFKLCTEPQGAAIPPTDAGTGTHTIKVWRQVQYAWTANDVGTTGSYKGWFIIRDGSGYDRTFPNTAEGIGIEVVTAN